MAPWNHWYHCMCNTYGTWLRGDPRGWRARHHREHVAGDYKHPPPPGTYDHLHARSQSLQKRRSVHLARQIRQVILDAVVASLRRHDMDAIIATLDDHHLHILARFPDHRPRHSLGLAKKEASRLLSDRRLQPSAGIWAKRSKCLPINDRPHQIEVVKYLLSHFRRGAALWAVAALQ
ncbi:MAG TPA: hypothetical protein VHP11_13295 [Tepidisphaeraceae bacterium]|nr:hypothetical protein [Tepidisphaeraceae bacterium]